MRNRLMGAVLVLSGIVLGLVVAMACGGGGAGGRFPRDASAQTAPCQQWEVASSAAGTGGSRDNDVAGQIQGSKNLLPPGWEPMEAFTGAPNGGVYVKHCVK